jgi:hypothetical protein
VGVMGLAVVPNKLHASKHLTDCEEAQDFCPDDTDGRQLLSIHVSDGIEVCGWVEGTDARHELFRASDVVDDGLEVLLELCNRSVVC